MLNYPASGSLNQVTTTLQVPMVSNAGALTVPADGVYTYDITGVLTAAGNILATYAFQSSSAVVIFDNKTTGGFPVTVDSVYTIPPGKTLWYYDGAALEQVSFNTSRLLNVVMVSNAASASIRTDQINVLEITGTLTAVGNITAALDHPSNSVFVAFDNMTVGGYGLTVNATWSIPYGRSWWYYNGSQFEQIGFSQTQAVAQSLACSFMRL